MELWTTRHKDHLLNRSWLCTTSQSKQLVIMLDENRMNPFLPHWVREKTTTRAIIYSVTRLCGVLQHVMRFAEAAQEVQIARAQEKPKVDVQALRERQRKRHEQVGCVLVLHIWLYVCAIWIIMRTITAKPFVSALSNSLFLKLGLPGYIGLIRKTTIYWSSLPLA